jgi:hypothetical protein
MGRFGQRDVFSKSDWTPFQTQYFAENVVALGIEPGTSGSIARNSDHETTIYTMGY